MFNAKLTVGQNHPYLLIKKKLSTINRLSKLFIPFNKAVSNERKSIDDVHKSYNLFKNLGLTACITSGFHTILPLSYRAVEKLISIVDTQMSEIGGQRLIMPSLINANLLKKSERWSNIESELFQLNDRHSVHFCLAPTHEEIITRLIGDRMINYKKLPLYLYQVTSKFRDEKRPRSGLLRAREFIMKDMYTFDADLDHACQTYDIVNQAYQKIFNLLDIPVIKVAAETGEIGGQFSHEYHYVADSGENNLLVCKSCLQGYNVYNFDKAKDMHEPCGNSQLENRKSIEVGHSFLLGTRYSSSFNARYTSKDGTYKNLLEMGCFGLGITRILAASVEVLSSNNQISWPLSIAPYHISIVPPKAGSKEEGMKVDQLAEDIAHSLSKTTSADILVDDRTSYTIGNRIHHCLAWGIPYVVVVGRKAASDIPKFEVINQKTKQTFDLTHSEMISIFQKQFPISLKDKVS